MNITRIITALLVLGIATPAAFGAKPRKADRKRAATGTFGKYDKNSNGTLEADEKAAVQKAFGTDADLKKYDTNGDGKLDDNEVSAIKPEETRKRKKKP